MIEHEHLEQCALIQWANLSTGKYPALKWLYSIPNGGNRSKAVAGKMKASGVKKGVYDLCLPVMRGGYIALYIEMKWGDNKLTPEQREFKSFMEGEGAKCVECWNWVDACAEIEKYLKGKV